MSRIVGKVAVTSAFLRSPPVRRTAPMPRLSAKPRIPDVYAECKAAEIIISYELVVFLHAVDSDSAAKKETLRRGLLRIEPIESFSAGVLIVTIIERKIRAGNADGAVWSQPELDFAVVPREHVGYRVRGYDHLAQG
jgi:hypothetical protein